MSLSNLSVSKEILKIMKKQNDMLHNLVICVAASGVAPIQVELLEGVGQSCLDMHDEIQNAIGHIDAEVI